VWDQYRARGSLNIPAFSGIVRKEYRVLWGVGLTISRASGVTIFYIM
jgi:hypothetical protein